MSRSDRAVIHFLADRLVHVYGESPNLDYIQAARRIAQPPPPARRDEAVAALGTALSVIFIGPHRPSAASLAGFASDVLDALTPADAALIVAAREAAIQ